jgi:beta-galactosidase
VTELRGHGRTRLNSGWLFGGSVLFPGPEDTLDPAVVAEYSRADLDDTAWEPVTLPHTVVPLSWRLWNAADWEKVWAYRRPLRLEADAQTRTFLDFDGVVTSVIVSVNDVVVGEHRGGYLPFSFEITDQLRPDGHNTVAVILDSRFNLNVPPNAPDSVPSSSIDFYQPGGIVRDVWLRTVPTSFVRSVATTHHDVLDPARRRSTFVVTMDSSRPALDASVEITLVARDRTAVAFVSVQLGDLPLGERDIEIELEDLQDVQLWDVDRPTLYDATTTLHAEGIEHSLILRTGFREATFRPDGFFLNGRRRYLLGVNRHDYFPFAGFAMPDRVHSRDAQILRDELNCVMVRCSHYPHHPAFLDACDELGLLVWEESPGWHFIGDSDWQDAAVAQITDMIDRDRHRPSIVLWGARLNETPDRPLLYARTEALVKALDPTRATTGATHGDYSRRSVFQHDVFAYDDYNTRLDERGERRPDLLEPIDGRPYLVSESVAARSSPTTHYRRNEVAEVQQHQALDYANAHNDAQADPRYAGLLAWIGFDYQSPRGNGRRGLRHTGLTDTFRVPKAGAALYRSQVSPSVRVVVEPAFTWDPPLRSRAHGYADRPEASEWGPGAEAMICSNCDRVAVYLDGEIVADATPDRDRFPHLAYPPSFVDLTRLGAGELRIDGIVDGVVAMTRRFSGDRNMDSLVVTSDDDELLADGVDATRVIVALADHYGNARSRTDESVMVEVSGPGTLIGESELDLDELGGTAGFWIRSRPDESGLIHVRVHSPTLGSMTVTIRSVVPTPGESRSTR